ncbi:unnamed protein product [Brassica rapa]|uniref:MATH domain-containing protein n=1 Tax=Brassica campestris TaxID=3711 RepID=A0A8D9MCH4_BRACM|nr:unnamed protein product [Brassica rapa]
MAMQVGKKFSWVIKDFPSLQCKICHSAPVLIGDCKWRLLAECDLVVLHLYMCITDSQPFPSEAVKVRLTIVNQLSEYRSILKESDHGFDEKSPTWGCAIDSVKLVFHATNNPTFIKRGTMVVNGDLKIVAEVISVSNVSEESIPLRKLVVNGFHVLPSQVKKLRLESEIQSMDVNGFQVLPSQVESVRLIFKRHPNIAVEFRAKNQHLRNACMDFLLSLIDTLCQSLEDLSNEDLVEADIALTYLKDAGFKVDWLEKKLDIVKDKKEKEQSSLARLQEMEDCLLKLKQQCSDLNALVEKEEEELSDTRTPMSFDDVV